MRLRSWMALGVTGLWILACGGGEEIQEADAGDKSDAGEAEADADGGSELAEGQIHVDYPKVGLDAEVGQFVLAPSRSALDKAAAQGKTGVFIYYAANIVEVGETESKVKSLPGKEFSIPNSLIVPIEPGYAAKKGDILLGHWESGSGMRRAIVTGGTATAPTVRYLERAYDESKASEQKQDTFEENRFHPLTESWQIGTTVACEKGSKRQHGVLTHMEGDQILVSLFGGKLEARDKADCVGLTPTPELSVGDKVHIPAVGSYSEGEVTKVEADIGRAWVKYTWGGKEKHEAFPIVDVATSFDGSADASDKTADKADEAEPEAPAEEKTGEKTERRRTPRGQTGQRPTRRR